LLIPEKRLITRRPEVASGTLGSFYAARGTSFPTTGSTSGTGK
jgi:hypothetical protein